MFTGIIEESGKVLAITSNSIDIQANAVIESTKLGDSIAVNGVCLTVTKIESNFFSADISDETKKVTTLKNIQAGSTVNLERALRLSDRLGGHIVSGHVDCLGKATAIEKMGDFYNLLIELPENHMKYVAKKGSITLNGISLTVAETDGNIVKIAVIPHTFENTNLKYLQKGDLLNVETDILAKYVEKFLSTSDNKSGISMEFLVENGF